MPCSIWRELVNLIHTVGYEGIQFFPLLYPVQHDLAVRPEVEWCFLKRQGGDNKCT